MKTAQQILEEIVYRLEGYKKEPYMDDYMSAREEILFELKEFILSEPNEILVAEEYRKDDTGDWKLTDVRLLNEECDHDWADVRNSPCQQYCFKCKSTR